MASLDGLRTTVVRANERIEARFGHGRREHPMDVYRATVADLDFDRALHLGAGHDRHEVVPTLDGRGDVVSLDPDRSSLLANDATRRVLGRGESLPFGDGTFDLVFSECVFEHLAAPWTVLAEVDRVLASGGSFVVYVPNPDHYYARIADLTPQWFHDLYVRLQGEGRTDRDTYPTVYNWGRLADVRRATEQFGWEPTTVRSFRGPTSYTRWLPIHPIFVLLDRVSYGSPEAHMSYLIRFSADDR